MILQSASVYRLCKQKNSITKALCKPFCDFARRMLILCATHVATLCDQCWDFARPMLRLCATQIIHVATLCDPFCDFARPKLAML